MTIINIAFDIKNMKKFVKDIDPVINGYINEYNWSIDNMIIMMILYNN